MVINTIFSFVIRIWWAGWSSLRAESWSNFIFTSFRETFDYNLFVLTYKSFWTHEENSSITQLQCLNMKTNTSHVTQQWECKTLIMTTKDETRQNISSDSLFIYCHPSPHIIIYNCYLNMDETANIRLYIYAKLAN